MNQKKPNIVFIQTDQQRADTLSIYGGKDCRTPVLDQFAQESVVFQNAYTSCPICTPARSSLQTGLYPSRNGMLTNTYGQGCVVNELPDTPDLLSRRLQQQNYSMGYTGKWHLGTGPQVAETVQFQKNMGKVHFAEVEAGLRSLPSDVGYEADDFAGHGGAGRGYPIYKQFLKDHQLTNDLKNKISGHFEGHFAAELASPVESSVDYFLVERAIHYIDQFKEREQPFFFSLNFWGPHEPYIAPTKHLDMYRDVKLEPWPNFYDSREDKPGIHDAKQGNAKDWETYEPYVKHYYAFMSSIDEQIGRLLQYLKDQNLYEDTMIIFTSDHGESLGIHGGLCDKAFFMYDETCKIPLMVKPAGKPQEGRLEHRFVGTCDIYSTILDYAGVAKENAERDGRSFAPLIQGEEVPDWPEVVVTECSGLEHIMATQRMIRKDHWKYVFNGGDLEELYNLEEDPYEMKNLALTSEHKETLQMMRKALGDWFEKHDDMLLKQFSRMKLQA